MYVVVAGVVVNNSCVVSAGVDRLLRGNNYRSFGCCLFCCCRSGLSCSSCFCTPEYKNVKMQFLNKLLSISPSKMVW